MSQPLGKCQALSRCSADRIGRGECVRPAPLTQDGQKSGLHDWPGKVHVAAVKQANPGHNKLIIKAGTYPKQDKDVPVIGYSTHVIVACDLPEATVYAMTKAMAASVDDMSAVVKAITGITPKDMALDIGVPLHKGAAKFYKEVGAI